MSDSTPHLLLDGRYRAIAPGLSAHVVVEHGHVSLLGTDARLHRLVGLDATALWYYARAHGWQLEARP